jgi:asparagine synthase (glutamine-hydrolysing)
VLESVARRCGIEAPTVVRVDSLELMFWGSPALAEGSAAALGKVMRHADRDLSDVDVGLLMAGSDDTWLLGMLPPFAGIRRENAVLTLAVDVMGFRQVYRAQTDAVATVGTSARVLASVIGARPNREALAVQAMLGWQLHSRTVFAGVDAVDPGTVCVLHDGSISTRAVPDDVQRLTDLDETVDTAAGLLRNYLECYLDEHPDAVLQLTGGQDSRILLSAIPKSRRRGLRAATLSVPGSEDADIAAGLSQREGLNHTVATLHGLDDLSPAEAYDLTYRAAIRLDFMADPLALASLSLAEQSFVQGDRLSGLGGEIARGFYYFGLPIDVQVTRRRVHRLATWRMFANESVGSATMLPAFAGFADRFAHNEVLRAMEGAADMRAAGDEFYYRQRMRRWGGLTDTAVGSERSVVNPMLDPRFLAIARGMPPSLKAGSLFLARLQMALDPELGSIPLDGRPAPAAYARRSVDNTVRQWQTTGTKAARKVRQRLRGSGRPPAGGMDLASSITQHWRAPDALAGAESMGILRPEWLRGIRSGSVTPSPAAMAYLINLESLAIACMTS